MKDFLRLLLKIRAPHIGGILTLAAMLSIACTDTTDDRGVHSSTRDDDLTLGEGGQVVEQITSDALDRRGNALLIDLVDDTHDALRLALAEYVGIQFAGALTDQANADAKLAPFGQHLFENRG